MIGASMGLWKAYATHGVLHWELLQNNILEDIFIPYFHLHCKPFLLFFNYLQLSIMPVCASVNSNGGPHIEKFETQHCLI